MKLSSIPLEKFINMKKLLIFSFLTACILLATFRCFSQDYNWGIGLRLGDPSGITIKRYLEPKGMVFPKDDKALELNIGRTHLFRRKGYYDNRFNDWYLKNQFGYKDFKYLGNKVSAPLGFQLHYLIHKDIPINELEKLQWYFGVGGQFRFQTYTFDYKYKLEGNPNWFLATGERVTDIDFGVDGVIGVEYIIPGAPVSVFVDFTLFMEIVDNPFMFWPQAGIGGRYNF